jgi:hypothetical protein
MKQKHLLIMADQRLFVGIVCRYLPRYWNIGQHWPKLANVLCLLGNVQPGPSNSRTNGLRICHQAGCVAALKRGVIPKFSIANGNWIGQLPSPLRSMSYGTRCLLRPIQSFGRITTFTSGKCPTGGSRLTGHVYSVKLNSQLLRTSVPFDAKDSPVRVLVLSPFASDASAAFQAKIV